MTSCYWFHVWLRWHTGSYFTLPPKGRAGAEYITLSPPHAAPASKAPSKLLLQRHVCGSPLYWLPDGRPSVPSREELLCGGDGRQPLPALQQPLGSLLFVPSLGRHQYRNVSSYMHFIEGECVSRWGWRRGVIKGSSAQQTLKPCSEGGLIVVIADCDVALQLSCFHV